jgi:penicillin-binding protein 1A
VQTISPRSTEPQKPPEKRETSPGRRSWLLSNPTLRHLLENFSFHGPQFRSRRVARRAGFLALLVLSSLVGVMAGLSVIYSIDLPQMEDLVRYRPNTTTELLDIHGKSFGSFALERRIVVPYNEFPPTLREAIISIEDKGFERNWGVNLLRAVSAAYADVHSGSRAQGSSTLTMQLARNLFLSAQKTYGRKLQEIFLSVQIERRFTKPQIFALYANQIYLGHGTYGFEAASEFYFSKHVRDLNLQESALLAALPKGPEYYSPLRNPERALRRRNLVLNEMLEDGKITLDQANAAKAAPLGLHIETPPNSIAPYFVEEVRRQLEKEYGADLVHGAGLRVYTTLDLDLQSVANKAILDGTAAYERRHGWKGNLQNIVLAGMDIRTYKHPDWTQAPEPGDYYHALVVQVLPSRVILKLGSRQATMLPADWAWTQRKSADLFLRTGDIAYVRVEGNLPDGTLHVVLQQDTGVQASMMAVDNSNGEVVALVGGRDFALSQFNRATQSQRQVGSSFKPYVYTAAVEAGTKPTDIIVDAPVSFPTPSGWYTPHNYEPDWKGPMSILAAFEESRNIPALKLAAKVGINKVIEVAHRFGITSNIPAFLPIAIGSADITLFEQVGAYTVFPNDGIRIEPHFIRNVIQADGQPLEEKLPEVREVISVETARTMMTLLQGVVQHGTAAQASSLKHPLGGKTGTTNDYTDAWFIGFSPSITCGTWIGFDDRQSLGEKETGARAALPMWMDFMKAAIAGKDKEAFPTSGAPKKQLDMPLTPVDSDANDEAPKAKSADDSDQDDVDPDAPKAAPKPVVKPTPAPAASTVPDSLPPPASVTPAPIVRQLPPASRIITNPARPATPPPPPPRGISNPSPDSH